MKNLNYIFLIIGLTLVSTFSCNKDKVVVLPIVGDCIDTVSFSSEIEPMIVQNCSTSGCHDSGAAAGYNLIGHSNIALNDSIISSIRDKHPTSKLVDLNKSTNIFFDYIKILQNAKDIHVLDSVWGAFLYQADSKYELFNHITNFLLFFNISLIIFCDLIIYIHKHDIH